MPRAGEGGARPHGRRRPRARRRRGGARGGAHPGPRLGVARADRGAPARGLRRGRRVGRDAGELPRRGAAGAGGRGAELRAHPQDRGAGREPALGHRDRACSPRSTGTARRARRRGPRRTRPRARCWWSGWIRWRRTFTLRAAAPRRRACRRWGAINRTSPRSSAAAARARRARAGRSASTPGSSAPPRASAARPRRRTCRRGRRADARSGSRSRRALGARRCSRPTCGSASGTSASRRWRSSWARSAAGSCSTAAGADTAPASASGAPPASRARERATGEILLHYYPGADVVRMY